MSIKIPILDYYEWQKAVLDKDITIPPSTPIKGDRYIIGMNPSGAWHNKPKRIAEFNGLTWDIIEPKDGMLTLVKDEGILYQYINSKWLDFALIIGKKRIENSIENRILTLDDSGKIFVVENSGTIYFNLPSVGSSDIGINYTFVKMNKDSILYIQTADSDKISDSISGGYLYTNEPTEVGTTINIMLATYNHWVIISGHGTWIVNI